MFTKHAERYLLRCCSEGGYLCINAVNQHIESKPSLEKAWIFHSHDGAVNHARRIGKVLGETPDVVKLDH